MRSNPNRAAIVVMSRSHKMPILPQQVPPDEQIGTMTGEGASTQGAGTGRPAIEVVRRHCDPRERTPIERKLPCDWGAQ